MSKLYYNKRLINCNKLNIKIVEGISDSYLKSVLQFVLKWQGSSKNFYFTTSGSTGTPKKIKFSRIQILQSAGNTINYFNLNSNDVFFVCMDISFVAAKLMLVRALCLNADIVLVKPTLNPLIKIKHKITFAAFVPLQLQQILHRHQSLLKLKEINKIIIGGAALNSATEKLIVQNKINAWHTYAMTETLTHIALRKIGSEKTFTTLPGIFIKTINGCLCVKSKITFNKWIQTNDLAKIYHLRKFKITGRADFIINSGAFKINPLEVENELVNNFSKQLQGVNFFIAGIKDDKLGSKCVLIIENAHSIKLNLKMLEKTMHKYKVPKQIIYMKQFIYTQYDKIKRLATLQMIDKQYNTN